MEKVKEKQYICENCGEKFKLSDFIFQSHANTYLCPECERKEYQDHINYT